MAFCFIGFLKLLWHTIVSIITASTADIGGQSDLCFLPTTPAGTTFSIWGTLYALTTFNLVELSCDADFLAATKASTAWVNAWMDSELIEATEQLRLTYSGLAASAATQCDVTYPDAKDVCCFVNQYATWAHSAYTQNVQMTQVYGPSVCTESEQMINASWAKDLRVEYVAAMTTFVSSELGGNLYGMKTLQHAASGICDTCLKSGDPYDYPDDPNDCSSICAAGMNKNVTSYPFSTEGCGVITDPTELDDLRTLLETLEAEYL